MGACLGGVARFLGGSLSIQIFGNRSNRMTTDDPAQDSNGKNDPRLDSLDMQLKQVRKAEAERTGQNIPPAKGMRQGNRVLTELIAGPAGGALIGYVIDQFADTSPAALLVCMFLGIAVAFRNIYKISQERPE
jgi:ATP synthase protein I